MKEPVSIRCVVCGDTADINSSWTSWRRVEHDREIYYACPREFPPAAASDGEKKSALQRFYLIVIRTVAAFKQKAGAH